MTILAISRDWGAKPSIVRIVDDAVYSVVTGTGYVLTQVENIQAVQNGDFQWVKTDEVLISYADGQGYFTYNSITGSFVPQPDAAGTVTSITGTTSQVLVNGTAGTPLSGALVLSLPQNIANTSSPTFAGLTLGTSALTLGGSLTTAGAFASTFTMTGATSVTFPTSGTLATTAGTVSSVTGTTNRITSTGGTTPVIDISASYVGQSSITTLGTIATGVWQGTLVGPTYGGTGVNNGSNTLTLGGNLITSGSFASTFTMTGATNVTFPTSGTLATTTNATLIGAMAQFPIAGGDAYLTGSGWLKCDGSAVSQSTYATLYSRLGLIRTTGALWTYKTKSVLTNLNGVSTNGVGNLYVMPCAAGVLYSSTDLVTLTSRTTGTASNLNCTTFGAGVFVAAGAGGVVISSTDGITWNSRTSNTTSAINAITFVNSNFVAVGAGGCIISSTDGVTWSQRTSGTANALLSIGFGNSLYVAAGATNTVLKSTDLVTWNDVSITTYNTISCGGGVLYFGSTYYLPANVGFIMKSTDLVTWSHIFFGSSFTFANAGYVKNGVMGIPVNTGIVYTTTDGINFTVTGAYGSNTITGACVDSTRITMVGQLGGISTASSADYTYDTSTLFLLPNLNSVAAFPSSAAQTVGQVLNGITPYYIKAL